MSELVQCDTATVTVSHSKAGTVTFTVPSYTVSLSSFVTRVHSIVRTYIARSLEQREPLSLGDFALHMLSIATGDPRAQMSDSTTAIDPVTVAAFIHSREQQGHVTSTYDDGSADCDDCNWSFTTTAKGQ